MGKILIFSRDIGGANLMIAAHQYLTDHDGESRRLDVLDSFVKQGLGGDDISSSIHVVAKDYATEHWRGYGVDTTDFDAITAQNNSSTYEDHANAILEHVDPALILTATTDVDDRTDLELWRLAARRNIPCAAFVDHRINLKARFFDHNGNVVYPDRIFVIDDEVRGMLIRDGAPGDLVEVIGDIHLERLGRDRVSKNMREKVDVLRDRWGAGPETKVILFVSECLREMCALGSEGAAYDEIASVESLISTVRSVRQLGSHELAGEQVLVVIRPHPKDTAGKYDDYQAGSPVRVIVDNAMNAETAVRAADIVAGMDSTMLDEAKVIGKPVVSNFRGQRIEVGGCGRWGDV